MFSFVTSIFLLSLLARATAAVQADQNDRFNYHRVLGNFLRSLHYNMTEHEAHLATLQFVELKSLSFTSSQTEFTNTVSQFLVSCIMVSAANRAAFKPQPEIPSLEGSNDELLKCFLFAVIVFLLLFSNFFAELVTLADSLLRQLDLALIWLLAALGSE